MMVRDIESPILQLGLLQTWSSSTTIEQPTSLPHLTPPPHIVSDLPTSLAANGTKIVRFHVNIVHGLVTWCVV